MKKLEIPEYPGYEATEDGRIFSMRYHRKGYENSGLGQRLDKHGYATVNVKNRKTDRRGYVLVHRLVAMAYLPKPKPDQDQIRHLDGNRTNNNVSNLRWGTHAENITDKRFHGRVSQGATHTKATNRGIRNRRVALDLLASLKEMVDVYWGKEGDGGPEPQCIVRAKATIANSDEELAWFRNNVKYPKGIGDTK